MRAVQLFRGDCIDALNFVPDESVSLIITSPPYADQRKETYGGTAHDDYVEWFLPRAAQFKRILKPTGTFILNIKENVRDGVRHTYVLQLILALVDQGWLWSEEFIWHKAFCYPGKWPRRFRDAWERLLQFNLTRHYDIYKEATLRPAINVPKRRQTGIGIADKRETSRTGSNMGWNENNFVGKRYAEPTNVLYLAPNTVNRGHPATFPPALPEWFIRAFTQEGDMVLDPFAGSGTALFAAKKMNRRAIGCEINNSYADRIEARIKSSPNLLL